MGEFGEFDPAEVFLTTTPGTQISFETEARDGPCWRCRLHLWMPPRRYGAWRTHWGCGKPSGLVATIGAVIPSGGLTQGED
jgi:hypothetical protein